MATETQKEIKQTLEALKNVDPTQTAHLLKQEHCKYMKSTLENLGRSVIHFDYGQPWIYYYILSTLRVVGSEIDEISLGNITKALAYCWNQKTGGFGGGYKQLPHLAPTYSAFLAILSIGPEAYHLLNKEGLTNYFFSCKIGNSGKFQMTKGAETDLRASYIVTIIVKLLHLDEKLLEGIADNIIASQTYEGGFSNIEGGEAHGGYTYCGVAALSLLGRLEDCDVERLMFWLSRRQCEFGGFNGRTNKLLDSCYSFWVGAIFNIVNDYFGKQMSYQNHLLYSEKDLQNYVTFFCQQTKGGLKDKPGKNRDIYHTWYSLSGVSLSQQGHCQRQGDKLLELDPIYNIRKQRLQLAKQYFQKSLVKQQ